MRKLWRNTSRTSGTTPGICSRTALRNALQVVGEHIATARIAINGVGASGVAVARMLLAAGARHVIACDRTGALYLGRTEHMNPYKAALAADTNSSRERGSLREVLADADVFIGLSGTSLIGAADVARMARDPIVLLTAVPG